MSGNTNRLDWVDTAKGLSIILVVMMHSAYGVGEETGGAGYLHYVIAWATPFRMPEFFLISGLFLSQVIGRDWLRFSDRRVIHYFYFYALWAVLQIVFKVGLGTGEPLSAASGIAWAIIEPYGVLWFIYMLAVFSLAAKLLHEFKVKHWLVLAAGAALQIAPIQVGSDLVDKFAEYFVYFYAGYALAPQIFRIVDWAQRHVLVSIAALGVYAIANALLVFGGGFRMLPIHVEMGFAGLPGLHLALAGIGSVSLCVLAALLSKLPVMDWLRWLGARSIVVYLSFTIPMAATRVLLLKLGVTNDTSVLSTVVFAVALASPLILYWFIRKTGMGRFLFERPARAHLSGAPGSRGYMAKPAAAPAE
ncbi:MAG: acyltransferase family protein [Devosia sp.]|nr:acyltransferase family protein [Devosia sp.]